MKRFTIIISIILAAVCIAACGEKAQDAELRLTSCDPVFDAQNLSGSSLTVTFTFNREVICSQGAAQEIDITGDARIMSASAEGQIVRIGVSGLEDDLTYSIHVPAGTIRALNEPQTPADEITYRFSMKASFEPQDTDPAKTLSNAKASSQAVRVYDYFRSIYGKQILTGAMAGKAWDNSFADHIQSVTGAYPAIVTYDLTYIDFDKSTKSDCPDYSDISQIKAAWDAHNIIAIDWTWLAPDMEDQPVSSYSVDAKLFKPSDVLTDGTWQHAMAERQIAKVAGYLTQLRDAGIPVLFRPLKEAAGDFAAAPLYWWGKDGADQYKKLWMYLYDELTVRYGLNNLIWVWTATLTQGKAYLADVEKIKVWYPGEKHVDIAAADILAASLGTTQARAFILLNAAVRGRKMVAMSECGYLISTEECIKASAPWLYFNGLSNYEKDKPVLFCRGGEENEYYWKNTESDWTKALNSSFSIKRDAVPSLR